MHVLQYYVQILLLDRERKVKTVYANLNSVGNLVRRFSLKETAPLEIVSEKKYTDLNYTRLLSTCARQLVHKTLERKW